jgi:hypothetical protein
MRALFLATFRPARRTEVHRGSSKTQGTYARATKDLDAAYHDEMDTMVERVTTAVAADWSGFTGVVTNMEPITRANQIPPPVPMKASSVSPRRSARGGT